MSKDLVVIEGLTIRQDSEGRYCLNDLHKAAGGAEKDKPIRFTRSERCLELVKELRPKMVFEPLVAQRGGTIGGTYVCKQLVYSYAMWISPQFHLKVVEFFDRGQTQGVAVADHAVEDVLNDPFAFMEKLFAQAKILKAERDALKVELEKDTKSYVLSKTCGRNGGIFVVKELIEKLLNTGISVVTQQGR